MEKKARPKQLEVSKTARYHQLGTLSGKTKTIWLVLHGYGQLSEYFIKNFEVLLNSDTCVIAPEGLSRFYLQGFSGRVGATWMTKEDRLSDIADNFNYLNQLNARITSEAPSAAINLLGFSQGAATAVRWYLTTKVANISKLIIWSGVMPPEISLDEFKEAEHKAELHLTYGLQDEFQSDEFRARLKALEQDEQFTITTFDGGHHIDKETLVRLANGG